MTDIKKRKHSFRTHQPLQNPDYTRREIWNLTMPNELPLYPFCAEEIIRSSRTWFSETLCRFMIVTIVMEGDILYRFEDREHLLKPGEILIIPQNASYFFKNGPSGGYRKIVAEIMGRNLQSIAETLGLNRFLILKSPDYQEIAQDITRVCDLLHNQSRDTIPALSGEAYKILTRLSLLNTPEENLTDLLAQAQMLLESSLEHKTTVCEIAARLGISPSKLNRLFQEHLGISPMRYRLESRIARAQ